MAQPALALPGPEVLVPIGMGLLQVVTLLWATLQFHRVWKIIRGPLSSFIKVVFTFITIAIIVIITMADQPVVRALMGEHSPQDVLAGLSEHIPGRISYLPEDFTLAKTAQPMPEASIKGLQQGGKIVIYLGEPEDYLNRQLPIEGYALRLADWEFRQDEILENAHHVLFFHEDHIDPPAEAHSINLESVKGAIHYQPPLPPLWSLTIPYGLMAKGTPGSPVLFSHKVPKIRSIDADTTLNTLSVWNMTTPEIRSIETAPRILVAKLFKDAAVGISLLHRHGQTPDAFITENARHETPGPRAGPTVLVILWLLGVALSVVSERFARRWRGHRLAARMRMGDGPCHAADAMWAVAPLLPATCLYGASTFIGLKPSLWAWNSPTTFSVFPWLSPVLLLAAGGLWMARANRLPPLYKLWSNILGLVYLSYLLGSSEIYLGHLPFPLSLLLACFAGLLIAPTGGQGWSLTRRPSTGAGSKALDLAGHHHRSTHVAEGVLIWPKKVEDPESRLAKELGPGPYLLRSSAQGENQSFGTYTSVRAEAGTVESGLNTVLESYGNNPGRAVLCMPFIGGRHSGVARVGMAGVHTAIGTHHDGITSGQEPIGTASWHRHSKRTQTDERFTLMATLQRWPSEEDTLIEWVGPWVVQCTEAPPSMDWFGEAWRCMATHELKPTTFSRIGDEDLASPSGPTTLDFWASKWRRDNALGQATQMLGVPQLLVPEQVVFGIGGGLYAHGGHWQIVEKLLWLRSQLPGWNAHRRLASIWKSVNPDSLDSLIRDSIALRMLQPYLPIDGPEMPTAPSTLFQRDPEPFPHRSTHDLDLGIPRLGTGVGPVQPLGPVPQELSQRTAAYLRDWVHDCMCRHIAIRQSDSPEWLTQPATGHPPHGTLSVDDLEDQSIQWRGQSFWTCAPADITGKVSSQPGPGHILYLETPKPALMRPGFDAIVCRYGSAYSHAALVCSQQGITALFGTGTELTEGDTVRLTLLGETLVIVDPRRNELHEE